jgi:hypothetical protein
MCYLAILAVREPNELCLIRETEDCLNCFSACSLSDPIRDDVGRRAGLHYGL